MSRQQICQNIFEYLETVPDFLKVDHLILIKKLSEFKFSQNLLVFYQFISKWKAAVCGISDN